ncbi:chromosome segregation protein SMC [Geotoga petraea]|uniref:Chromosome partition protein Smc n=1 Tax=Geotoga petraea TaxID=28234 RepID=A0A1G6JHH1_9BACT|nr:chromosome segregation protein SMC [Geotoga petraea]SDC18153.1 condensin subunit Smc [Geotoga petraea]
MKMLSLEVEGFKSFAKKTIFNLDKNIIAIVGPNGSGKSNIVDAIRWLLGEQSGKQMRISDSNDVVFAGTDTKKASNYAKVEMIFEADNKEIIKIAKKYEKNSSNKYYINNKICTLKDIHDIFSNKGVGKQFYSIISQGQVSEIVNSSPEQLRQIILDASDIGEYITKKENTLKLLEKTSENLERLEDLLFVTERRLRSLSNRAGRAKSYLKYKEEIKVIGKKYFGAQRNKINKSIKYSEEKIQENQEYRNNILRKSFEVEREYKSLKEEITNFDETIAKNSDLIDNYRERISVIENEKEILTKKTNDLSTEIINIDWQIEDTKEKIKQSEFKLEETSTLKNKYEKDLKELTINLEKETENKEKIKKTINDEENKLHELNSIINRLEKENNDLIKEKNQKLNENEAKDERLNYLNDESLKLNKELVSLDKVIEEIEYTLSESNEKEKQLYNDKQEIVNSLKKMKENYDLYIEEIENNKKKISSLNHEKNILLTQINHYEGFAKVVQDFFTKFSSDDNVIDVVANLFNVDQKFEEAVSSSVGGKLQNVVIKSSKKTREYIDYLKSNSYGKITFLSIDILNPKSTYSQKILNEPGVIDYLINTIDFDKKYEKIMKYVFSNVLLVDELNNAIKISKSSFRGNIVTLGGELISGYGAITGGRVKNDYSATIIKRKNRIFELDIEIDEAKENIKYLQEKVSKMIIDIKEKKNELEEINENINQLMIEKDLKNNKYTSNVNRKKELKETLKKTDERISLYKDQIKNNSDRVKEIQTVLDVNKKTIEKSKNQLSKIEKENIVEKEELNEINLKIAELNMEKKNFQEKFEFYTKQKREILDNLNTLRDKFDENQYLYKKKREEKEKSEQNLKDSENEYNSLNNEITNIFEKMKNSRIGKNEKFNKLEQKENEKNELKDKLSEINNNNQELKHKIENLKNERQYLIERAENVDISEDEFEIKELSDDEIKSLKFNFDELQQKLKNLGSVDLTVLEEYNEVNEEYNSKKEEKEDIEESITSLKNSINQLDEFAENKYSNFHAALNEEFGKYIQSLFPNGYGELRLIGEGFSFEKGIQISVKKSGRKFQKLSLFSGGEKALIAIAFLFAMMSLNPSPFYILDEIDAPLDDINASKISELINDNAEKSQFLMITHNKLVMEIADVFHGITMKGGITRVVPVDFKELQA